MNYYIRVYKYYLAILLILLTLACLLTVTLSIHIFITPELHQQFLDITTTDSGWAFSSYGRFSTLITTNQIIKPIFIGYSVLISGYLMTTSKLQRDSRIIGKTQVINNILTISIFPLLLLGLVTTICRAFINYPYPAYFLVVTSILILGILLIFKIKLELLHTNYKYTNRLSKDTIMQIVIYVVFISLFILFRFYLILAIGGMVLIIAFTKHLIKYTTMNVGI